MLFRESVAVWPTAVLMFVMGVASRSGCVPLTRRDRGRNDTIPGRRPSANVE